MMTYPSTIPTSLSRDGRLAKQVLEELISQGIEEFCLCPGGRNAPLVYPLANASHVKVYYWPEERSAAYFALGRIKATGRPVCVVTTSGTATGELLPAAIEAHYTGLPLVLLTADRPRRFRGSGAPQSSEQVGIFSYYANDMLDLEGDDPCKLDNWKREGPIHVNVCFEEPKDQECQTIFIDPYGSPIKEFFPPFHFAPDERYLSFLKKSRYPLVILGSLYPAHRDTVAQFLLHLQAPVYAEGISGLREDPRLEKLQVTQMDKMWRFSAEHGYPIDGILRIGGVPTARLWRDIEHKAGQLAICSISDLPFSGLSCADVIHTSLNEFLTWALELEPPHYSFARWKEEDRYSQVALQSLFEEEPLAEQSLIHALTKKIPPYSKVFLGNSLPIREWDQAAIYESRHFKISCSRGANGIDGQIATFLGYSSEEQDNWALLGDLTVLYDLVGPWITPQIAQLNTNIVVVNNSGAGIFARMHAHPAFQNRHQLSFGSFAQFWNWRYERWEQVPDQLTLSGGGRLIELVPDLEATERFLKRVKEI